MPRSRVVFFASFAVALLAAVTIGLFACGGGGDGSAPQSAPVSESGVFPLRVEPGKRYLVDASGRPFLLHIDTAWSLIADLSIADAERYLEDRRQKGFNAIVVSLLEHRFATNAPNNFYGVPPFTTVGDYSARNEAYFGHAELVVQRAAAKGLLVLLTPSYIGAKGGNEGWFQEMAANGPAKMRDYGHYLGKRFGRYSNILWVHAGDFDPPPNDKALVSAIALGIRDVDTISLHTAHCAPETSALDYWSGESWLQVNNIYTYLDVPSKAESAYSNPMPFLLFESRYENERTPGEGTEQLVRVQAYQALLSGAMGQAFGNNPIWHFTHPGIFPVAPQDWKQWLDSAGALGMVHVHSLFSAREWWKLEPDFSNALLTGGYVGSGVPYDRAVAAKASDGTFALAYMPSARALTVDFGQMAGPHITARWYDPASGQFSATAGSPFAKSGGAQILPVPGTNSSTTGSFTDWVLVLESTS